MEDKLIKALKKLISEGYKLKAQHNNKDMKYALENAEELLIEIKNKSLTE